MARETYVLRDGELVPKSMAYFGDAPRVPQTATVLSDIAAFKSPLEGHKLIDGRSQLREELKRNNCRQVEPSEWRPVYKNPTFALKRGLALNGEKR